MVIGRDWNQGAWGGGGGGGVKSLQAREVGSLKEKSFLFAPLALGLQAAGSRCCAVSLLHDQRAWGPAMTEVHEI